MVAMLGWVARNRPLIVGVVCWLIVWFCLLFVFRWLRVHHNSFSKYPLVSLANSPNGEFRFAIDPID